MNYYNEFDPFAAEWLANLIEAELIPAGNVDSRSIKEVTPDDLHGYKQCHFFAGIGGWSLALQMAAWPTTACVWTGSCPCQPFSAAGKRKGAADDRHLWPEFYRLIAQCRPPVVFGEQVASKDGLGWLDGVFADLEGADYACGAADLCAAGVGAPHIRQRLYWVADSDCERHGRQHSLLRQGPECGRLASHPPKIAGGGKIDRLADAGQSPARGHTGRGSIAETGGGERLERTRQAATEPERCSSIGWLGDSRSEGLQERVSDGRVERGEAGAAAWQATVLASCRDGKARRVSAQSGDEPLAYGIPAKLGPLFAWLGRMGRDATALTKLARLARRCRTGRLKGYGNAIVPQVAAEFVMAYMQDDDERS